MKQSIWNSDAGNWWPLHMVQKIRTGCIGCIGLYSVACKFTRRIFFAFLCLHVFYSCSNWNEPSVRGLLSRDLTSKSFHTLNQMNRRSREFKSDRRPSDRLRNPANQIRTLKIESRFGFAHHYRERDSGANGHPIQHSRCLLLLGIFPIRPRRLATVFRWRQFDITAELITHDSYMYIIPRPHESAENYRTAPRPVYW